MNKLIPLTTALACLLIAGCSTPRNVNPPSPRANTGYVDFYTDSDMELSWDIKRGPEPAGEMQTVFSDLKPVTGNILRLEAPPGTHRFTVWFNNQFTAGPQTLQVKVVNGMVTPVHVTLTSAGSTYIDNKEYSFRGSSKGYARGTKVHREQNEMFRIGVVAGDSQPYQSKERMVYFAAERK